MTASSKAIVTAASAALDKEVNDRAVSIVKSLQSKAADLNGSIALVESFQTELLAAIESGEVATANQLNEFLRSTRHDRLAALGLHF